MTENVDDPRRSSQEESNEGRYNDINTAISFRKLLLGLVRHRLLVVAIIGIFVTFGLAIAILKASLFTATAQMVRDMESNMPSGNIGASTNLIGLGMDLGSYTGLTPDTYPTVLKSREVRIAVARTPFFIRELGQTMSLVEYYNRPPSPTGLFMRNVKKYTIELPKTSMNLFKYNSPREIVGTRSDGLILLTLQEEIAVRILASMLYVNIDRMSGVMSVSFTSHYPHLSALVTNSFIEQLQERVKEIYVERSKEQLEFLRNRSDEAVSELELAEKILAKFIDSNRNPQTAKLQIDLEGFRRQVTMKTELYGDLQAQLTQVEFELKRNQPIITILQAPYPPEVSSSPRRKKIVILSLILGVLAGIFAVIIIDAVEKQLVNDEARADWLEIKQFILHIPPLRWMRRPRSKSSA